MVYTKEYDDSIRNIILLWSSRQWTDVKGKTELIRIGRIRIGINK